MTQKWMKELPQKTGRSLEEWLDLITESGPPTEKERREWLKKDHKLGTNYASWLAGRAAGKNMEEDSPEAYLKTATEWVEMQYAGPRAALRPLYEELLKLGLSLGKDVKACPCKTMVPFYRNHVFAQIKPSTNTRIDLGLALGNLKTPKRLIDTGGYEKRDRITRRIEITAKADIDEEVKRWLKKAYDLDA
jgi:predicted transport protein